LPSAPARTSFARGDHPTWNDTMPQSPATPRASVPLQLALLALVALTVVSGVVPTGLLLERWLARELEERAWRDAALAPGLFADRTRAVGDALMMRAKDLAHAPELVAAVLRDDGERARRIVDEAARALGYRGVLVAADATWAGPSPDSLLVAATRRGEMPLAVVADSAALFLVSLAPVLNGDDWIGAAGVASSLDEAATGALAALTRSDLVLVLTAGGTHAVKSAPTRDADAIAASIATAPAAPRPRELRFTDSRYLVTTSPLAGATVAFVRDLGRDLSILPQLRRVILVSGVAALLVALLLGSAVAAHLSRPVRSLADAAHRLSHGDFTAPLPASPVREVRRVTDAFGAMRSALSIRIDELRAANRLLEERQARLSTLQAELLRRERVAVSGRMAVELAHEIRNPVANLRNCLELIHRRLEGDDEAREYAALAIDELLRMHELAERMLDLNRPREHGTDRCDAADVAREVAALVAIGGKADDASVAVQAPRPAPAAISAEALKQVLLNLVQNSREAMPHGLRMEIAVETDAHTMRLTVRDNGPGIPSGARASVFEPFFTTRAGAGGIGLGLFVVEGIVRGHGGTVELLNEDDRRGAGFRISLRAVPDVAETANAHAPT
jgi:signal transduction histidine kinase